MAKYKPKKVSIGVEYEREKEDNPWPAIIAALIVVALVASACGG